MDRCKHIFKLSQGEYVAPERVESVYLESRFVSQVFVDGDAEQTYPVAIVVPEFEPLIEHVNAKSKTIPTANGNSSKHNLPNGNAVPPQGDGSVNSAGENGDDQNSTNTSDEKNTTYVVHGKTMTMEQLCGYQPAIKAVFDDIIGLGKDRGLKGFEQV